MRISDWSSDVCSSDLETAGLAPGWTRDRVVAEINAAGAPCFTGTCPEIYREGAFAGAREVTVGPLDQALALGETSLMFQVDHMFQEIELVRIVQVARSVLTPAARSRSRPCPGPPSRTFSI